MPVAHLQPKEYLETVVPDTTAYSREEALEYTRWLATHHYENFQVVSFLLPKELHQDFYNVYAFCRWADDLGDEIEDPGKPAPSGMVAKGAARDVPRRRFASSLCGASRYGGASRYPDRAIRPLDSRLRAGPNDNPLPHLQRSSRLLRELGESGGPPGPLSLRLSRYRAAASFRLHLHGSATRQFWQDVTVDLQKDRVYLPLDLLSKHQYSLEQLFAHEFNPQFRSLMAEAVEVAGDLFRQGRPLIGMVDRRLSLDLDLFSRGGGKILAENSFAELQCAQTPAPHFEA